MNRMNSRSGARTVLSAFLAVGLMSAASSAFAAKDDLQVSVSNISPAHVSLTTSGGPLAEGAYSGSSSIVLRYTLEANAFPMGDTHFGSFALGQRLVSNFEANKNNNTSYPLTVTAQQNGTGQPLRLAVATPSQQRNSAGDFSPTTVSISTSCSVANPCPNNDGAEIEANLQFSSNPTSEVNTSTKVKVVVTLVHPKQCVKFYNFITDQDLTTTVTSTDVNVVKSGKNEGKVTSTSPFGQFSDNVLVVNTCSTAKNFDLEINLDDAFDTNPHNNPGNAVFTYLGGANVDPDTFQVGNFSLPTPHGQLLCLNNVTLGANQSLLATVHMGIKRGIHRSQLGPDFAFTAAMLEPNTACGGAEVENTGTVLNYTLK